ncbi:hypothetical protein GH714_040963 [Hevea brasiliensis]|uniref:Uncharacterized protein n=1 Tax=Hevea brasiliensis TaxID=3981 RepID=A0A6A6MKL4_HEVBR|nr:hypothetical protein GH714_040963 [Hevea brasiliensis]
MDFWRKARSIAEDATKSSQELTKDAAKRSQELTTGDYNRFIQVIRHLIRDAKRLKEITAEKSKRAYQIKTQVIKRADQIKSLPEGITPSSLLARTVPAVESQLDDKEKSSRDDSEMSDVPMVSNMRQDLTQWQESMPTSFYQVSTVKKPAEQVKDNEVEEPPKATVTSKPEMKKSNYQSKTSALSFAELDLDAFLLGGDSDGEFCRQELTDTLCSNDLHGLTDDGDGAFDDDFDKEVDSSRKFCIDTLTKWLSENLLSKVRPRRNPMRPTAEKEHQLPEAHQGAYRREAHRGAPKKLRCSIKV